MIDPHTLVSIGLFIKDIDENSCSFWMQLREERGPLNGLWEFPGGKIELEENPLQALIREISEETGVDIRGNSKITPFSIYLYEYSGKKVCLHTFLINAESDLPLQGKWFKINYEEKSVPLRGQIPEINHQIINDAVSYVEILLRSKKINQFIGGY